MLLIQGCPHYWRHIVWVAHRPLSRKAKLVGQGNRPQAPLSRLICSTKARFQAGYISVSGCGSFEGCRGASYGPSTPRGPSNCYPKLAASGTYAYGTGCKFLHTKSVSKSTPPVAPHTAKGHTNESKKERRASNFPAFFANYPEFQYNPAKSAILEFNRLCKSWRKKAHQDFKDAMVKEFNDIYGTDESNIDSWRKICIVLDIDPLPDTVQEARDVSREPGSPYALASFILSSRFQAILSKHINLVDLTENPRGRVRIFDSLKALSTYTKRTEKYFPKKNAYAGGLLKYLLREIHSKYAGHRKPGDRRRHHQ
ncbi:hypothetical protein PTI98_009735 [Pleurotus ostreatus]|nr:hypothetical protein PTI98_009735 [Pleurotus ostreatus]